jgi:16S rRNA (cytosine967-C5)-methyltransferase
MRLTTIQLEMAILAIRRILPLNFPADILIRGFFRENPMLGHNDRAIIAEIVFGILRHKYFLDTLIEKATPRALLLAKFQGINSRELINFATESEIKWLAHVKSVQVAMQSLAIQAELPQWLIEKLQTYLPDEEILKLGVALQQPAPLDLRVNTLFAKREEILAQLEQTGVKAKPTPYSPIGIRLAEKPAINQHPLFLEGKVEIQDESSQLSVYLLAPRRGEMIVDFCAGSGGKTLLIGALMQSHGRIYAFDVSDKRLNNLKPRLKRSGLSNIHPVRIDNENDLRVKRLTGKIDRVLIDLPCSGLGTLRRNPDLKWRQSPISIEELKIKQRAILCAASKLLKPGGRLVYATCSLLPEENQAIVERFLMENTQFIALDCSELLTQQKIPINTGNYLQLSPVYHHTDGFFAAALELKRN